MPPRSEKLEQGEVNEYTKALNASNLGLLYMSELRRLVVQTAANCERIFHITEVDRRIGPADALAGDDDLHNMIMATLLNASQIGSFLFAPDHKPKKMSRRRYNLHQARALGLKRTLGNLTLPTLSNRAARNTLAHYDEYLDSTIVDISTGKISPPFAIMTDFVPELF